MTPNYISLLISFFMQLIVVFKTTTYQFPYKICNHKILTNQQWEVEILVRIMHLSTMLSLESTLLKLKDEDRYCYNLTHDAISLPEFSSFGIFDGHAGDFCLLNFYTLTRMGKF
jgi:hypothetical protein